MCPSHQASTARPPRGRVLVTGGAGFIGAALCRRLVADGCDVIALDDLSAGIRSRLPASRALEFVLGDAGDAELLGGLLEDGPPVQALVHLAAVVGVRRVLADPEGCRDAHERLGNSVAQALRGLPVERRPRLYAASTSEVYAESAGSLREDSALRTVDGRGRWAYAGSKRAAEVRFDAHDALWPATRGPVHLRFFNVVGPGQSAESGMVLPSFVERARAGLPLEVHGDGQQVRTFAHVDEVAACVAELVTRGDVPAGPLNIGGNARSTIGALADLLIEQVGGPARAVRVDPRHTCGASFEDVRRRIPDLTRLASLGVSVPSRSLAEIVLDCLAHHPHGASLAAAAGRPACASPVS